MTPLKKELLYALIFAFIMVSAILGAVWMLSLSIQKDFREDYKAQLKTGERKESPVGESVSTTTLNIQHEKGY